MSLGRCHAMRLTEGSVPRIRQLLVQVQGFLHRATCSALAGDKQRPEALSALAKKAEDKKQQLALERQAALEAR